MSGTEPRWRRYLRLFGPDPRADVDDELRFHWEELMRRYRSAGMDDAAAERAAREQFGDLDAARRSLGARVARRVARRERSRWAADAARDLRLAIRKLLHAPGFTAAAVATLALGIGANAAVFSVVNTTLLRPLPYPEAGRIASLYTITRGQPFAVSPPDFADWREQTKSYTAMAAYSEYPMTLTGYGDPQPVPAATVTSGFFAVMGVAPQRGRPFTDVEQQYPTPHVAVISDGLWRSEFGGRADVLGRTIQLDATPYEVIGVMPPGFAYPSGTRIWTPWAFSPRDLSTQRGAHYLRVVARLRSGVTVAAADGELRALATRLAATYPASSKGNSAVAESLRDALVGSTARRALLILLGAVGLVALIACANVANLLLARGAARQREFAVRTALGARPGDLVGMALTESLVLAVLGGAAGLAVAWWATAALDRLTPNDLRLLGRATLDGPVVAFTFALSLVTGLVFGLAPALQSARSAAVYGALQAGGRAEMISREGWRVRSGLVAAELALSVMLLAGAGLLIRSFQVLQHVDPGYRIDGALTFDLTLPDARYPKVEQVEQFFRQLTESLRGIPGVTRVAGMTPLPLSGDSYSISTYSLDGVHIEPSEQPSTQVRIVTPGVFETMGMRLLRGREFTDADREDGERVAALNASAAKLLFPGVDPIGHSLELSSGFGVGRGPAGGRIVALVADIHDESLGTPPRPTVYLPHGWVPSSNLSLVLRAAPGVDPLSLAAAARARVWALDRDLPLSDLKTLTQLADGSVAQPRFAMLLLATFAFVAVTLAAVGIFGVMSYIVGQRAREIGVRMALGASGRTVIGETLRRAMVPVLIGESIGLLGALGLTRTMQRLLYGVTAADPVTFAAVAAGLAAVAAAAAWMPARRASRVDPMIAIRAE